jgi:hypothetical protein
MSWEYRVVLLPLHEDGPEDTLNELGREDWELVQVVKRWAYLKRPLGTEQPIVWATEESWDVRLGARSS